MAGQQGRFQLVDKIGHGSYGAVHKAIDTTTGAVVAVKIVPMSSDAEELSKLVNEVEILRECRHENITGFIQAYVNHDDLWIAMEFCGGGSALTIMKALKVPFTEEIISAILRETLHGLVYLHVNNRIHRDIKAANILFTDDGKIKLADFGVSAQLSDKFSLRKTCIGSPYWMAPEVLLAQTSGQAYSVSADVWSVGITALELAQMKPPLDHLHPMRAMYEIPHSTPPKLKDEKKWSKKFQDFIADTLIKSPTDRPAAAQLLKHPFIEAHKNVSVAAIAALVDSAHTAKAANRQKLLAKYGVSDQSVSAQFDVAQSLAVAPPAPPKALAVHADAVVAAAQTDTLRPEQQQQEVNITRSGTLDSVASEVDMNTLKRTPSIASSTSSTTSSPLKPRKDVYYGTVRKDTLDKFLGLSDFLGEDVDDSELSSSLSFLEMLEADSSQSAGDKHHLSGLLKPGGPVPDSGKKLFSVIELGFAEYEISFADIWGRYVLMASDRGLYGTVAGSTMPPKPLLKGESFKRIDILEEYGVMIALCGKSNSVRVYDLALLRKVIECVFQPDGSAPSKAAVSEIDHYLKQLDATCEKLPNTRSTEEYRLTRLEKSVYLTILGKKTMSVFSWAAHPFNRFMEVISLSFIVTYPTLIGLVAGSDRLKNYLIQVKDDLFLIDFHSTEMSFIDIKPAFSSDGTLVRRSGPVDVSLLLDVGEEKAPPLAVLSAMGGSLAAASPAMSRLPQAIDRRGSATSMASLQSFVDQMRNNQIDKSHVAIVHGDLNSEAMLLTVEDKSKYVTLLGDVKSDTVIRWSIPPLVTVLRQKSYIMAFTDALIEIRSPTTGDPIQSLYTTQLKLRMLKQSTSGLAILALGTSTDKKRPGCVLYSLAPDA